MILSINKSEFVVAVQKQAAGYDLGLVEKSPDFQETAPHHVPRFPSPTAPRRVLENIPNDLVKS